MNNSNLQTLLIVDDRYDYLSLMEVILESEFEVNIMKANSAVEAKILLEGHHEINAIISGPHPFASENEDNYYLYNLKNTNLPFISYCSELNSKDIDKLKHDNERNLYLENPLDEATLYPILENLLNIQGQSYTVENQKGVETPLKRIKLSTLRMFSKLSYDLYLKLNGEKFIQVGKQGNDDLNSIVEHYTSKGINHLYLQEKDYERYLETAKDIISTNTRDRLKSGEQKQSTVQLYDFAFQISREHLNCIGLTRMQEELVHQAMENIILELKNDKVLYSMIKDFYHRENYLTDHSLLIIYLSSMILSKMGWSNDQTLQQVIYAGFFHDMFIPEELSKVQNINAIDNEKDRSIILRHIKKAAHVLENIKRINNDAHKMIIDHHEKPDGSGYPLGLTSAQLPPLSCVFITAHHIVDYLYGQNFDTSMLASFIQNMQGQWDQGNFKRVYSCTRSLLLD